MKIKASPGDLIEVVWLDSNISPGWMKLDHLGECSDPVQCRTAGYFQKVVNQILILVDTEDLHPIRSERDGNGVWEIPLGSIFKVINHGKGYVEEKT